MSVASRSRAMRSVMSSMCGGSVTVYQRRLCLNTTWALSVLGEARMPTAPSRRSEGIESNVFPRYGRAMVWRVVAPYHLKMKSSASPASYGAPE